MQPEYYLDPKLEVAGFMKCTERKIRLTHFPGQLLSLLRRITPGRRSCRRRGCWRGAKSTSLRTCPGVKMILWTLQCYWRHTYVQIHTRHKARTGEVHERGEEEQPWGGGETRLWQGGGGRQELRVQSRGGQSGGEAEGPRAGQPGQMVQEKRDRKTF